MGVLDDPGAYYAPLGPDWSQGDLAVAPTAVLWGQGERPSLPYPQPPPLPNGVISVVYDLWEGTPLAPAASIECFIGPVMVVSDDCAIDKEFNARVDQLIAQGLPESAAEAEARNDDSLDPLILVAPVLPYESLRFVNEQAVRTAQAVGYFPIVGGPEVDEGYLDLGRVQPVSRGLLSEPFAALSEAARSILRWKLAQYYAARNLS